MHALVWISAGRHFAIASSQVTEVLPLVETVPLMHQPKWVRGLINYRGRLIPMLDMAVLLGFPSPEPRMTHRVIVVQGGGDDLDQNRWFGVQVDCVLGLEDLAYGDPHDHPAAKTAAVDFLGPVTLTESGTIQWVDATRFPALDQEARATQ